MIVGSPVLSANYRVHFIEYIHMRYSSSSATSLGASRCGERLVSLYVYLSRYLLAHVYICAQVEPYTHARMAQCLCYKCKTDLHIHARACVSARVVAYEMFTHELQRARVKSNVRSWCVLYDLSRSCGRSRETEIVMRYK